MIDLDVFKERFIVYEYLDYADDFYGFWRWKVEVESKMGHILDGNNKDETYKRLSSILPKWLTYRPYDSYTCLKYLTNSLEQIATIYDEIRKIDLLNFDSIQEEKLQIIWHELGCTKEEYGQKKKDGKYYIIAITKPLMFIWGQTLAFDINVRRSIPKFNISGIKNHVWSFKTWKNVMFSFQQKIKDQPEFINLCREISTKELGSNNIVPFGQFLDLYYWVGGRRATAK